jgi:hypothetical protein
MDAHRAPKQFGKMVISLIFVRSFRDEVIAWGVWEMEDPLLWKFIFECTIQKFKLEKIEP